MLSSTHWASVNAELLSAVLTLADLPTKIVCECVCKAWRRALRDEPDEGLWGDVVTLQSLPCKFRALTIVDKGFMITQPHSSKHSAALAAWLVQRVKGMKQVILGYPKPRSVLTNFPLPDPLDNGTFSATRQVLLSMAAMEVADSFRLAVFEMDPSMLLDEACHQFLVKHCVGLSLAAGPTRLTSAHMQALCSLTKLKVLELETCMVIRSLPPGPHPVVHLPQGLTQLTSLHRLTALSFQALPPGFSSLQQLNRLYLAPPSATPHDLSMHTQLTQLHIGTRYAEPLPLTLPAGPNVSLVSLILHSDCHLHNLGDCTELRDLEIVPALGLHLAWTGAFPTALPHLTQLIVDDPAELHGGMEVWGQLPDEWQNYTALRKLCIPDLVLDALPEWLTTLSELRILEMPGLSFNDHPYFPSLLRHMPKLEVLDMECIDTFIVQEVICLAQIPNLVSLVFGCIGSNPHDDHPAPPLEPEEIVYFQQLAAALEAHPNNLKQTSASLSSDQIWNFRSVRGQDPFVSVLESFVSPHMREALMG